ncbi:MAG: hypothetical protein J6T10_18270 [Methanobrevibacter sp.]|nr:hypothetical protein [Methanobrevibacter sp.]
MSRYVLVKSINWSLVTLPNPFFHSSSSALAFALVAGDIDIASDTLFKNCLVHHAVLVFHIAPLAPLYKFHNVQVVLSAFAAASIVFLVALNHLAVFLAALHVHQKKGFSAAIIHTASQAISKKLSQYSLISLARSSFHSDHQCHSSSVSANAAVDQSAL